MKNQIGWLKWLVCIAVFGMGTFFQAHAQTTEVKEDTVNDDYFIDWIKVEYPPLPPVKLDGKMVPWEQVHDLPPMPEMISVKRLKNPPPPEVYDPQKKWIDIKRRLAPWMSEIELRKQPLETP